MWSFMDAPCSSGSQKGNKKNGVGPHFAFDTAAVLFGMDSYKFWTVRSGILYHSSWITSSCCFRDVGGGNLFLTLVSKTDESVQWYWNLVIQMFMDYVEVHFHALQIMIEQFRLYDRGQCRLGKLHCCSEITSGSWDASDYPTCPRKLMQYFGYEGQ
jgi:hypothetical protein